MTTIIRFCPFISITKYISVGDTVFASSPTVSPATLAVFRAYESTNDFYSDRYDFARELLNWFMTSEQNIAAVDYICGYYYQPDVSKSEAIAATRSAPPPSVVPLGFGLGIYTSIDNFYSRWVQQYASEDRYFAE